jgi:hypothetical protein
VILVINGCDAVCRRGRRLIGLTGREFTSHRDALKAA